MPTLPEGVLTLFFSDVEGSTRLATMHGDAAWAEMLETHRTLLRQVFSKHGGVEVDTQGDSFFAVFQLPSDAVAAALAAQRALTAQTWPAAGAVRVRIGLHTGETIARGNHYVGQEIHRASRICDAGHGGQIVVSQTTAELVRDKLPDGATLAALGDYRLKDLGQPQRLFQLSAAGLLTNFPALRSLDVPTNLPTERSSFIGRDAEISAIRERVAEHRLVTLTGIGGSGKTRLALQVGARELGRFADGVFFVDLAPVRDRDLLAATVASACGLMLNDASGAGSTSFEDRLIAALARRKALVIVDNCEHMVEAVAGLLDRILADCARVTLLATSREALAVEGEQILPVPSLAVPDVATLTQAQAEANDAVRLFVERAKAVKPGFALGPDSRDAVVEICRRLDGIPLAIEFAASRVAHLSVQQIAGRLQDRFHLLTGGRQRIQRQKTLSAALDWSHELLSSDERAVFRRLAVFAGSFALDAAESVCSGEGIPPSAVLDLMGSLVAKSLVTTVVDDRSQTRYRLLETVRMYASDKLAVAGETPRLLRRHAEALLALLVPLNDARWTTKTADQVRLGAELDNLRVALAWAESVAGDRALACALLGSSGGIWIVHALLNEGIQRALDLLPLPSGLTTEIEARFNLLLGSLGYNGARRECFVASLRAAQLYRSLGNTLRLIDALVFAAQIGARLGETQQAAAAIAEAEALIDRHAPPRQAAALALSTAVNHLYLGQYEQAVESALRQAAFCREGGHEWGVQLAMINVAFHECGLGHFDAAIARLRSTIDALRRTSAPYGVGNAIQILAHAHAMRGDRDEAFGNARAAVPYLHRGGDPPGLLLALALVHARHGAEHRAASLLAFVEREFAHTGRIFFPMLAHVRDEIVSRAQAALEPAEFDHRKAVGAGLTEEQAVALALDESQ